MLKCGKHYFFAVMKWLPSQCRYWSVCVTFLWTVVTRALLGTGETKVSRKVRAPFCFGSYMVTAYVGPVS